MFNNQEVWSLARNTSRDGEEKVQILLENNNVDIYVTTAVLCVGTVNGYNVTVTAGLDMTCTCKAWEKSDECICKHGCAMAITWRRNVSARSDKDDSIAAIVGQMPDGLLCDAAIEWAEQNKAFADYLRERLKVSR